MKNVTQEFIVLPFCSAIRLSDVIGFDFNPPIQKDSDLTVCGYVHFRNGQSKSICAGDSFALAEFFAANCASISPSKEFEDRMSAIAAKKLKATKK